VELNAPDIKRDGFNFTDGVGYISMDLIKQIAQKEFRFTELSGLQIRLAGAKGVLMAKQDMPEGIKVILRDS